MRIYILGGSGFIGRHLAKELERQRLEPEIVRRPYTPEALRTRFVQSIERGEAYAICNLAGASLNAKRWTAAYRREIVQSRVETVRSVVIALRDLPAAPKAYLQASAVGYYGTSLDETFTELSRPETTFSRASAPSGSRRPSRSSPSRVSAFCDSAWCSAGMEVHSRCFGPSFKWALGAPSAAGRNGFPGFMSTTPRAWRRGS
ncbi:NAD-dependent epimerase/dehydratase family protein [Alicyclobacillus vulcanalis]|uniref:NAD-dependent epimerase/dehydratase family protein n=1 Tax=Alicyclobacillus vulcanalis TaxID=252246 RepID=UPI001F28040A|nr:NAD-dependent epimerase/dehydratase family protein [Alicyclobacillus vulcanalis]